MASLSPFNSRGRGAWVLVAGLVLLIGTAGSDEFGAVAQGAARSDITIPAGQPTTLDPALQGDISSAAYSAQLYESLTAFDASLILRPALAGAWDISADGRRIVFHLRPGLTFSDGTALTSADVVQSWLRIIDPRHPSQLAALLQDVHGAADYLAGRQTDPASVGLHAEALDVSVDLDRPGVDFPAIVSSPTFGVVPPKVWRDGASTDATGIPSSGAYVVSAITATEYTLRANPDYWAGPPAITTVHLLTTLGGKSPVAAFQAGTVDYAAISPSDASWIRYDATLGPQLRTVPSLAVLYIGFTTDRPPFNDVRVRQAFAAAVDWARITELGSSGSDQPATSMVPPGIPGGGTQNWLPAHDPAAARQLLAAAGYPGGVGFPDVTFGTGGIGTAEGIAEDLHRELGVTVHLEELANHFARLQSAPPAMWSLGWVADYPGANDFLGVLLGTGSSNNYGRWTSPAFDAAIGDALAARDPSQATAGYERALGVVRDQAPVVPLSYGSGWALSRAGLLGAGQNGLGVLRLASLAWR